MAVSRDDLVQIRSREDFVAFAHKLSADFRVNPEQWEQLTVDRYIESLAAWAADMDGYFQVSGHQAPAHIDWQFIATLLLAAKTYE